MRRPFQLATSLLVAFVLLLAASAGTSAHQAGTTFLKPKPAHGGKPKHGTNLFSHGGSIESSPKVYIVFWGSEWSSAGSAQAYVTSFFSGVGGSTWASSTTQYCQGVPNGTSVCASGTVRPDNKSGQLAGNWNDSATVPASPTQNDIANEAARLASHFGGVNASADYMVFTPSGHSENGFGTVWCAYHSSSGSLSYSYIPYQPDAGAACGQNFVNSGGNGQLDGFSIVGGHEYAETITDPFPNSGWLDSRGAENADKCAWISSGQGAAANISLTTGTFAAQSLWSNAFNGGAGGCVLSYT